MALNAYLRIEGERGVIEGDVVQAGREGLIEVNAIVHGLSSPHDPSSGSPTGRRQHKPFTFTKSIDRASPLLFNTLVNNTNVPSVELQMWRLSSAGTEEHYYTYTLTNATISDIRIEMLNNKYPENQHHEIREHVSICYQRITAVHEASGIAASDQWEGSRT